MVVCKYFLQGYCKYDTRCRFDHFVSYRGYETSSDEQNLSGVSILKGGNSPLKASQEYSSESNAYDHAVLQSPHQQQQQYHQKGPKFNVGETMQTIAKDVVQSENCNQWQLSCYSPSKELPNFPGLEDHSPEEIRWECYKALQTNTVPLWQAVVQQLYTNVAKINNDLKKKTSYTIIDKWLREIEGNMQSTTSQQFGTSQVNPDSSINMAAFGGSNVSIFGGSANNSTPFGSNNVSPFGFQNNVHLSPSSVGNVSSINQSSFFSPANVNTNQANSFSFLPTQEQVNAQRHAGIGKSMFGGSQDQSTPSQNSNSFPSVPSSINLLEYSKEEELSPEELEAFKSEKFVLGRIPTKPPPVSLVSSSV